MRIPFPYRGLNKGLAAHQQMPFTSPGMNNMRLYDTLDTRARGGQRPGLDKWGLAGSIVQIGAAEQPIVALCTVSSVA